MNKEEKDLIQCDLVLTYIKNKDYSTYYRRKVDGMAIDNDILKNEDNLYITTLKKYNDLQQENKQLKEEIKQYQKELEKADSITQSCIFQGKEESRISFRNCLNKMTDYKTRIDKAIEYIEKTNFWGLYEDTPMIDVKYGEDLLEILKGSDNK